MSLEPEIVKPRRVNEAKIANDNGLTPMSGMSFRDQRMLKQRLADLMWQRNFAMINLKRWRANENGNWTVVQALKERADAELLGILAKSAR